MSTDVREMFRDRIDAGTLAEAKAANAARVKRARRLSFDEYVASVRQMTATRFHCASSSLPSSVREVIRRADGSMSCSCPARGKCVHMDAVEESLKPVEIAVCDCYGCKIGSSLGCYRNLRDSDMQQLAAAGA